MYRAYYTKPTGKILFLSNEESTDYLDYVEVPEDLYITLITGREKTTDYVVGHLKSDDGTTALSILPKVQQVYSFKNTFFEWISNLPTANTELTVVWNITRKQWEFSLSPDAIRRLLSIDSNEMLVFFVILEHDFDFLIRTMFVDPLLLLDSSTICIPFEQPIEEKIDKISIATKLTMQSYGLKIYDKN